MNTKDITVVDFKSGADIVVVNTCTVTENGNAEKFNVSSDLINTNCIGDTPTVLIPKIERGTFTVLETSIRDISARKLKKHL